MFKQVRRSVNRVVILLIACLIAGCVFGPFEIVHKEGSIPKGRVNISDSCKVRVRMSSGNSSNAKYACMWIIDRNFNIVERHK
jgi:hypothetical protein